MKRKFLSKEILGCPEKFTSVRLRICFLAKGDFFIMLGKTYTVTSANPERINYRSIHIKDKGGHRNSFGARCQAKVLLITENP